MHINKKIKPYRGSSLLEVMITVLIISFGLLGIAGLQSYAISVNNISNNRSIASMVANDLVEIMRGNPTGYLAGGYNRNVNFNNAARGVVALAAANVCAYPNCVVAQPATYEANMFRVRLKAALPAGDYRLIRNADSTSDLWIIWAEQQISTNNAAGEGTSEKINDNCPLNLRASTFALRCFYMRYSP